MKNSFRQNSSRILAMILAGAMVVSLGTDVTSVTNVYAAESTETAGNGTSSEEQNEEEVDVTSLSNYGGSTFTSKAEDADDADDADTSDEETTEYNCGLEEHTHTAKCYTEKVTDELICGKEEGETESTEEHTHTLDCYKDAEPTCGLEESEGSEGHQHMDACYEETETLTCTQDEHTHSEEAGCYDEDGNLICEIEEHTHGDDCYETERTQTCGKEEGDGKTEGHTHTLDCYKDAEPGCGLTEGKNTTVHHHTKDCYKTEKVLTCDKEQHTHTEACKATGIKKLFSKVRKAMGKSYEVNLASEGETGEDVSASGVNMSGYITSASFQKKNGVIWEESKEFTTADQVRGTINFENIYTSTIKNGNNTVYIDLPAYIDCSQFTGTYDTYDGSTHSGKYTYEKNADGTYRIKLVLDNDYVEKAGDTIGGSLQFNFTWTKDAVDDSGTKKVEIGNWSGDIKITEDKSGDDKPSSANYSIYKQAGSLQIDSDGKAYIDYTVTLTVKNGMTAPINMKDVLTGEGFTYDSTISVTGGDVKVNFGTTQGQGTSTQIQLWPNSGSTVEPGTYTIKYRVKSLSSVTDPSTTVPSTVDNKITVPEDGDNTISSETHTSTTRGTINKQGQLVSGSDATYIDYTVYLNAGAIITNLKTPANFTDTLPDTLELQGDVTVKQYDVTGTLQNTTTATVDGQNISYTTPIGQYYYVITYRTKVKDSELTIGGSVTIKNDGKSTGGVDGSSSSEITVTNHKLTKSLVSGSTGKNDSGTWVRTSNWTSNVAVKGELEGYVYEDYSSLFEDPSTLEKYAAMKLVEGSVVIKDASGNTVSSDLYTLEKSSHVSKQYLESKGGWYEVPDGLFKITFKKGVMGPVTIEYQTTADMSKISEGAWTGVTNHAELSKNGHTDTADAQDNFQFVTDNKGLIYKKRNSTEWSETSGATTLEPGQTSIPWVILVNRSRSLTSDLTITDTIKDGLIFLEDTFDIKTDGGSIKNATGVKWSYNESTGKLEIKIPASAYKGSTDTKPITISFRTQLPDDVIDGSQTNLTYKNTATLETNGSQMDSTYEQTVVRQVVGKSGSYDKNTHILSYNVVVNPDASQLNSGNALTVKDTLDAGSIADYVRLHSLEVFTALKTVTTNTDGSETVKVEPGQLVKTLTQADSGSTEFTYTWDEANKSFTTYLPDQYAYVIVAKYYIDTDVTEAVAMKNTVEIVGHSDWKKEDSSTKVEANTSGETHTNKVTVVKHDTAQYSTLLAGASFELDKYENNAWTKVGDATTAADGTASINPVTFNTLYKLGETQAPDGYILDEGPSYFIVATTGTSEEAAKAGLPDKIDGDAAYSKDAVRVYYAKNGTNDYINIEIDRYNAKDTTKVEPGQLRVNKVWVDSKGDTVTDPTELAKMSEVTVTLTKKVANTGHTVTIKVNENLYYVVPQKVNSGGYIYFSMWSSGKTGWDTDLNGTGYSWEATNETDSKNSNAPVYKLGPITSDLTLTIASTTYYNMGTFVKAEGGTAPSGTTDTIIRPEGCNEDGSVTLGPTNDWSFLYENLERGDGITYTITETTVSGYTTTYTINGTDLQPGQTFTPNENGDKVTVTNTAYPEYELPETGGTGTLPYEAAGSIAILGAMFYTGYSRRKRKGGQV